MWFCFSNCDFIYSNVTVFLYSYLTITLLLLPIGGNKLPYLRAPQVASVSESVHSSRSFTFPSFSGDYIVWGQIYVSSGLGCNHPKSQIRYSNSLSPLPLFLTLSHSPMIQFHTYRFSILDFTASWPFLNVFAFWRCYGYWSCSLHLGCSCSLALK